MTTRKTLLIDRFTTFVLALLFIAGGAAAIWWWTGRPIDGTELPTTSDTTAASDLVAQDWFAWTAAVVGVLLALVALRWIAAHVTPNKVSRLRLGASDTTGRLDASAQKVAGAAADAYADTLGVRSAKGSVVRDRGQLVARIDATIEPDSDLALLSRRADEVSSQLLSVLERPDLRCSLHLKVALRGRGVPRAL
ncbi:hypothetical protein [Aeromicrobium alkaliterrae]|uniref:Alkaline shock response membrane anchor protein AmaP n=1 Tax=Aeromicrobium alkaliterrae TaxID=302168 RepID=A0ABP4W9E8_9ACTN